MTLYEVFPNGEKAPLDLVENYKRDCEQWNRKTADANLIMAVRILAGLEKDVYTNLTVALDAVKQKRFDTLSVLYLEESP